MMTLPNRTSYNVERKEGAESLQKSFPLHNIVGGGISGVPSQEPISQLPYAPSSAFPLLSAPPGDKQDLLKLAKPATNINELPPSPDPSVASPSTRMYDSYKTLSLEGLTQEEIQEKKNYVQTHRLQPHMLQIIEYCKKEGIIPSLPTNLYQPTNPQDYSLSEFLESQGIECPEDEADPKSDEFTFKLQQLKTAYNEELEKLNRVCNEFITRMVNLLREQGQIRHVSDQEIQAKTTLIQQKFDYVRTQLRTNVCNAILVLQKQYNHQSKKRRRSLSKRATEILSQWFFEHINDPYPSDEEKSLLAAQCVLSLNQVNNWFGNKRIRYKRKCLEEEARRQKIGGSGGVTGSSPVMLGGSPSQSPPFTPPSPLVKPKSEAHLAE